MAVTALRSISFILVAVHLNTIEGNCSFQPTVCKLYLMVDGNDMPRCGSTEHSACRTLLWSLDVYYNYTQQVGGIMPVLRIITDISLAFNKFLVVRIKAHNYYQTFSLSSLRSHVGDSHTHNWLPSNLCLP